MNEADSLPNHAPLSMLPALNAIMDADPSGWPSREPTEADYVAHKAWAVSVFGSAVWSVYARGGWADDNEEPRHVEY